MFLFEYTSLFVTSQIFLTKILLPIVGKAKVIVGKFSLYDILTILL